MARDPRIYCIGDSHANFFSGRDTQRPEWPAPAGDLLPGFRTFRIGAVLAYNLCREGTQTRGREKLFELLARDVPHGARVMLCFGEIDCRAHLLRQARLQNRDAASVAEECAERYFSVVREVQALGFEVLVWNAIPSSPLDALPNKEFPSEGDCLGRNAVTRLFNEHATRLAQGAGVGFVSIFDQLTDARGLTRGSYYRPDKVHLSQRAMMPAMDALRRVAPDADFSWPLRYRLYRSAPLAAWRWAVYMKREHGWRVRRRVRRILRLSRRPATPSPEASPASPNTAEATHNA